MNRTRTASIVSVLWLVAAVGLLLSDPTRTSGMSPNEWGDYFAGVFAPLAFLWLVLGYMQQGEELRLSTEALRLQADELRHSVEQQRALVEVSRQQVEAEREALAHERRLREDLSLPKFAFRQGGGGFSGGGRSSYRFTLSNSGHAATDVALVGRYSDGSSTEFLDFPLFEKGAQHELRIERESPLPIAAGQMRLEYTDGLGRHHVELYEFGRSTEDVRSMIGFARA